jgi:hypothetical protein
MPRWSYFRIQICREQCEEPGTAKAGNRTSLCVDSYERVLQNRLHLYIAADASMVHVEHEVIALVQG